MAAPGVAVPGSVVAIGSQASPAGPQGIQGPTAVSADSGNIAQLGSDSLILVPQSQIWSVRLRSFNACGNPNFEIVQRNCGVAVSNPAHGTLIEDRWIAWNNGALNPSFQAIQSSTTAINIPGTSFGITRNFFRIVNQTQKTSLAAADIVGCSQSIEGPQFRELINDVHSVSILCRSSVANLKFGLSIRDVSPSTTKCLTKLCTLGAANTFTLITLQNLPVFPSGNFTLSTGAAGYAISVLLACGSTYMSPANDTWQSGNFVGAVGQDNFLGTAVNSTFDLAFIQHEPGSRSSTLMDVPFSQNYRDCLRYYQKSYGYGTVAGSVTAAGLSDFVTPQAQNVAHGTCRFPVIMATVPTITLYAWNTGVAGSVVDAAGTTHTGATASNVGDGGFSGVQFTGNTAAPNGVYAHYTADTGF